MLTVSSVQIFLLGLFRTQLECDVSPAMRKDKRMLVGKKKKKKEGRRRVNSVTSQ